MYFSDFQFWHFVSSCWSIYSPNGYFSTLLTMEINFYVESFTTTQLAFLSVLLKFLKGRSERQRRKVSTHWTNKNFCLDELPTTPFYPINFTIFPPTLTGYVLLFLHLLSFSHICMCRPINNSAKWKCIYIFSHSLTPFLSRKRTQTTFSSFSFVFWMYYVVRLSLWLPSLNALHWDILLLCSNLSE